MLILKSILIAYVGAYLLGWAFRKDLREVNAILSELFSVLKLFIKLLGELFAASTRVVMQFMIIK